MKQGWIFGTVLLAFGVVAGVDIYEERQDKQAAAEKAQAEHKALMRIMPPVMSMLSKSGKHKCGSFAVGPNLLITAAHCISKDTAKFHSTDENGKIVTTTEVNVIGYGIGAIKTKSDNSELSKILQDPDYQDYATDAALVLTNSKIGDTHGVFPIVSLDSLKWENTNAPDITKTPIKQLVRWSHESNEPDALFAIPCYAYRKEGIRDVIAHDCSWQPGTSGSPLVVDFGNGVYGSLATQGSVEQKVEKNQSAIYNAFSKAMNTSLIRFSATLESIADVCDRLLDDCSVVDDNGRLTLHVTGP